MRAHRPIEQRQEGGARRSTGALLSAGRLICLAGPRSRGGRKTRVRSSLHFSVALVLVILGTGRVAELDAQQAHLADISAVNDLTAQFAEVIRGAACETLRTGGVGCNRPGLQDSLQKLQARAKAYKPIKTRLDKDMLEEAILPQIEGVFQNASRMLITIRDQLEKLIITGHRIETLTGRDLSKLPEWDATHPRWKEANDTVLSGKIFDKPVIPESSLKYPPFVSPGKRRVMIAANASSGLDEHFASNMLNPHNKYLRWQRFVSNTGMTRQFPGTYDIDEYDNRLKPWYKVATQTPKRVVFLLDLSGNMLFEGKIEIAKMTIVTLLDSLIEEDYVNLVFIDNEETVPACFPDNLVPATPNNINELKRFVNQATVGAADKLTGAFSRAHEMFSNTDKLVSRNERLRTPEYLSEQERLSVTDEEIKLAQNSCRGNRCSPMQEYVMLVSDGGFKLDASILEQFETIARDRPLLHTISIAVGKDVHKEHMTRISCAMNGLYFHINPIPEESRADKKSTWGTGGAHDLVAHESYILSEMNEFFQMVAAPLARNHSLLNGLRYDQSRPMNNLSLDVTWSLPTLDSKNEAVVITIALPCFGDSDKSTPRLLGAVAIDLLFLLPGEHFGSSLISYFFDVEKDEPVDGLLDLALVFRSGYAGLNLVDKNLLYYYEEGVENIKDFKLPEHYNFLDYVGRGLDGEKGKALMNRILSVPSGLDSFVMNKSLPLNAEQWMHEPLRSESMDMTCAWLHVPGHPFVLVLLAKGRADDDRKHSFMTFEPKVPDLDKCGNTSQADALCWGADNRHLMAFDQKQAWESWMYISKGAFLSTATYLQQDALALPPRCSKASPKDCPGAPRLEMLMGVLNELQRPSLTTMTGNGLTVNAFKDVLLTSLVEPLWQASLKNPPSELVRRVFLSTSRGVFRTRSPRPPQESPAGSSGQSANTDPAIPLDLPFLHAPHLESWYNRAQGVQGELLPCLVCARVRACVRACVQDELLPCLIGQGRGQGTRVRVLLLPQACALASARRCCDDYLPCTRRLRTGRLAMSVLQPQRNRSIVVSQAIRHGYIKDSDPDFGMATCAVCMFVCIFERAGAMWL